jgi:hypothetical protein
MKQPPRRYCQYNNEGTDEIILPLFPHTSVVVTAFSAPSFKTSFEIEYTKYEEIARKLSGLEEHSRTLHNTPTQYLCIHYSKINAQFSQHFSFTHRINT